MQIKTWLCAALLFYSAASTAQKKEHLTLARLFGDNMVIQQGINAPIWGWAAPATNVTVTIAGNTAYALAGADGKWELNLPVMTAGGPYDMLINSPDEKRTLHNVMVGEVWLASGQSNMNYRAGVAAKQQLTSKGLPMIREFYVPERVSETPQTDLKSREWKLCNQENVAAFSAVAFYFAKNLHLSHKVAVGIIHASHGGTTLEGWLSAEALLSHPDFRARAQKDLEKPEDWATNQRQYDSLSNVRNVIFGGAANGIKQGAQQLDYPAEQAWPVTNYPIGAQRLAMSPYNFFWVRKTIDLPENTSNQSFKLDLGPITSSNAIIYFNGKAINQSNRLQRIDSIPAKLVRPGKNVIAILFISGETGGGGIGRDTSRPRLFTVNNAISVPLTGQWHYNTKIETQLPYFKPYNKQPTIFYNGMINPLLPFVIRGVLWYQGENNAGDHPAMQYQTLLPLLMCDWRTRLKHGYVPFIIAQLPNFKYAVDWAMLREAQLKVLNYPETGLAVTIDQRDPENVHPREKSEVGRRMYLAAEHVAYHNISLVYSGPLYSGFAVSGDTINVKFSNTGSGLIAKKGLPLRGFEIAGADHKFMPATAVISGAEIKVFSQDVKQPLSVRYAWAQDPVCDLFNQEGLPASPFRTDNW